MEFKFVYKICSKSEWLASKQNKKFIGTKKDIEDGFIHFSDKSQIKDTLNKYFSKKDGLILLKIETVNLDNLIWEQASNGNMFPHLYTPLNISSVCNEYDIVLNKDGTHTLPSIY